MNFLKGWRTRLLSFVIAVLGLVELLDPNLVVEALGLGEQGRAITIILIAIAVYVLRQITTTPPGRTQ